MVAVEPRINRRAAAASVLVCVVVAALFASVYAQMREGEQRTFRTQMDRYAEEHAALLRSHLASSAQALETLASLWEVDLVSSRQDFAAYARRSLPSHPALSALEWVPRVTPADRPAYARAAREDGYGHFEFSDFAGSRSRRAVSGGASFPVYYVEPRTGNEATLGVDLASDADLRAALEAAQDTGQASATRAIDIGEGEHGRGFLMFVPVYCRAGSVASLEGRRRSLTGFVVGVIHFDDLVRAAGSDLSDDRVVVTIADSAPATDAARPQVAPIPQAPANNASAPRTIDIGGQRWSLRFRSAGAADAAVRTYSGWVPPLGLIATALLGAYLWAAARRAIEIERRVQERTAQLSAEIDVRLEIERSLADARDALERRVRERTGELGASNRALQEEIVVRKRAEHDAARANAAKSVFLASMSHEIRTPLNAIIGYAQLLEGDRTLPAPCRAAVQKITTGGAHLLGLLSDVLDLSQIEAGHTELREREFDLAELLSDVGLLFENPCASKGLEFGLDGVPPRGTRVIGDPGKLRQVLINLTSNAVKFTDAGSVRLVLRSSRPGATTEAAPGDPTGPGTYVFEVADTGPGIPAHAFDDILLPFHQEKAGRMTGGSGLGLAIARRFAELMGGTLAIRSELGVGSTFALTVRLGPVASDRVAVDPARQRLAADCCIRAIVADDVRENREVLARMLADFGCEVVEAEGGAEALDLVEASRETSEPGHRVLFLDIRMPEPDGRAVLARLRARPVHGLRVVAHSASALVHERREYVALGFDDFLAKPVARERVFECLQGLPGVVFVDSPDEEPRPFAGPPLPSHLAARISQAARVHNATALRACLREVEALGPTRRATLERLRAALQAYDMSAIASVAAPHSG